ncbi:MAG: hypothetical protein U0401_34590, partial [Anaerolineae bacterium]
MKHNLSRFMMILLLPFMLLGYFQRQPMAAATPTATPPTVTSTPVPPASFGRILYSTDYIELVMADLTGHIYYDLPVGDIRSWQQLPNDRVFLYTTERDIYLLDAAKEQPLKVDINRDDVRAPEAGLRPAAIGQNFAYLQMLSGRSYLLNLASGQIDKLTTLEPDFSHIVEAQFSPNDTYLALTADEGSYSGVWLIPTADFAARRFLGTTSRLASFGAFSQDGQWLLYNLWRNKQLQVILERLDGSESRLLLASAQGGIGASFTPDQQLLLKSQQGTQLSLRPFDGSAEEQELDTFSQYVDPVQYSPNGQNLLVRRWQGPGYRWYLLNLATKSAQELTKLQGYLISLTPQQPRWLIFTPSPLPFQYLGRDAEFYFISLDLETGETRRLLPLQTNHSYFQLSLSTDGRVGLLEARTGAKHDERIVAGELFTDQIVGGGKDQLWLLPADTVQRRLLAETENVLQGTISPDGRYVALSQGLYSTSQVSLLDLEQDITIPLGKGY